MFDPEQWKCDECDESNIAERPSCYSCFAIKPGPRTPPDIGHGGPRTPPDIGHGGPRTPPSPTIPLEDSPPDSPEVLEAPPPLSPLLPSPRPLAPRATNGSSTASPWVCRGCSSENSGNNTECYRCDEPRVITPDMWTCPRCKTQLPFTTKLCGTCVANEKKAAREKPYWECGKCLYKTSHGPHCFQCGTPRSPSIETRDDNWECAGCSSANYVKRTHCYKCHAKPGDSGGNTSAACRSCKFTNDASRSTCLLCGADLPPSTPTKRKISHSPNKQQPVPPPAKIPKKKKTPSQSSTPSRSPSSTVGSAALAAPKVKASELKLNIFITPEDWKCPTCNYKNIALRNFCKDCDAPRKCVAALYVQYKKHGPAVLHSYSVKATVQCSVCKTKNPKSKKQCSRCLTPLGGKPEKTPADGAWRCRFCEKAMGPRTGQCKLCQRSRVSCEKKEEMEEEEGEQMTPEEKGEEGEEVEEGEWKEENNTHHDPHYPPEQQPGGFGYPPGHHHHPPDGYYHGPPPRGPRYHGPPGQYHHHPRSGSMMGPPPMYPPRGGRGGPSYPHLQRYMRPPPHLGPMSGPPPHPGRRRPVNMMDPYS